MSPIYYLIGLLLLVFIPLLIFYFRSNWQKTEIYVNLILLPFIWLLTYAPIHELSHILGYSIAGVATSIDGLPLHLWEADFGFASIIAKETLVLNWKILVVFGSPYILDLISVLLGLFIFKKIKVRNSFFAGFAFLILCLRPLYDIVANYAGIFYSDSELVTITKITSEYISYTFGIISFSIILLIDLIILGGYNNYPDT